jgi:hypothetical protein
MCERDAPMRVNRDTAMWEYFQSNSIVFIISYGYFQDYHFPPKLTSSKGSNTFIPVSNSSTIQCSTGVSPLTTYMGFTNIRKPSSCVPPNLRPDLQEGVSTDKRPSCETTHRDKPTPSNHNTAHNCKQEHLSSFVQIEARVDGAVIRDTPKRVGPPVGIGNGIWNRRMGSQTGVEVVGLGLASNTSYNHSVSVPILLLG